MRKTITSWLAALALLVCPLTVQAEDEEPITVFAAASLSVVMPELGDTWAREGHTTLRFSFGPSGTMARQISLGAPADLFISANPDWTMWLEQHLSDFDARTPTPVAHNRLVLVAGLGQEHHQPFEASELKAVLPGHRLAIADAATAPLGAYSQQALDNLGVDRSRISILPARDARMTLALVERGAADMAIVYRSAASRSGKARALLTLPETSHGAVAYQAIMTGDFDANGKVVADFMKWLSGEAAAVIWQKHGFDPIN